MIWTPYDGLNKFYIVKSKVYIYPKNWVNLPVIQMTQRFGYNSPLVYWYYIATIEYDSCSNQYQWLVVTFNNMVMFSCLCFNHNSLIKKLIYTSNRADLEGGG